MSHVQVRAVEADTGRTPATARLPRCASAGATPRGGGASSLEPATPRSAAHAQDEAHRRWLEDLRAQYGHPAVTGAPQVDCAMLFIRFTHQYSSSQQAEQTHIGRESGDAGAVHLAAACYCLTDWYCVSKRATL